MEHLSLETLARLVDEAPTDEERRHLATCEECVIELDAMRDQVLNLGSLPDVRPPKGDWEVLEARLVSEGLVRSRRGVFGLARTPGWMKAAAAVVLFAGGTGAGVVLANSPVLGTTARTADLSGPYDFAAASPVESVDEAAARLRLAERYYMDALVQYRQVSLGGDGSLLGEDPQDRVAALEHMVRAGQAAIQQAPADLFLNGMLATFRAELESARDETMRRASTSGTWY